jgi:protease I
MDTDRLKGKKVAVIVEHKFIPEEFEAYRSCFALLGMTVDFFSRIWYGDYTPDNPHWRPATFYSDVDPSDNQPWQSPVIMTLNDENDISNIKLDDHAAVIMAANYISVRLRYTDRSDFSSAREFVQSAPVSQFFASAMKRKEIIKGALCHGLWILTPYPELLNGRNVTCHTVVMADIVNCNANIMFETNAEGRREPQKVVVDDDLVTGFSKHEVIPFIQAIARQILSV